MTASRRIDLPDGLFNEEEAEKRTPTPLEKYLGRVRGSDGKLVPRKKRTRTVAASSFDHTRDQTKQMIESGEWEGCQARHIVAIYDIMHERVYGFAPTMTGQERYRYTTMAGAFVKRAFAGDFEKAADFYRWVWMREAGREKWRREERKDGGRLGIRLMFHGSILDDYRLAMARASSGV